MHPRPSVWSTPILFPPRRRRGSRAKEFYDESHITSRTMDGPTGDTPVIVEIDEVVPATPPMASAIHPVDDARWS